MTHLYLTESDTKLGFRDGQIVATKAGTDDTRAFPFATIEGISVFGMAQLSTQLIRECVANNIPIGYYSDDGHYFGCISSFERLDPSRQKRQVLLTDNEHFCVEWSKRVVAAKIRNSLTLLNAHRDIYDFTEDDVRGLRHSRQNLVGADSVEMILGFEGNAAKNYFKCLSKLVRVEELAFSGRSARPPKDPFNSMISFGYSLLYRHIIGAIERHGLHPYFAFMHKLQFGHAALASDLVEEYRAPIVDETVLSLVNSGEISRSDFYVNDAGATYMNKATSKRLTDLFSDAIAKNRRYFAASGDRKAYGFQVSLDMKINSAIAAIDNADAHLYQPFIWEIES